MAKGVHDARYRRLIDRLIAARRAADLTQTDLAQRLGKPQQFVSRYEVGDRRLDAVEYVDVANAIGLDPLSLLAEALKA